MDAPMTDEISISFRCEACNAKIEWPDDAVDSTEITCKDCGKYHGTYEDLRHTAMDAAKTKVRSLIEDVFKRR